MGKMRSSNRLPASEINKVLEALKKFSLWNQLIALYELRDTQPRVKGDEHIEAMEAVDRAISTLQKELRLEPGYILCQNNERLVANALQALSAMSSGNCVQKHTAALLASAYRNVQHAPGCDCERNIKQLAPFLQQRNATCG